jgi:TfoX/Sxy family transcriptional regulator of competence genes
MPGRAALVPANPGRRVGAQVASPQSLILRSGATSIADLKPQPTESRLHKTLDTAYGTVQPEYVEVPDSLLSSTQELKKFFDCSYDYVGSLKPKPTTRKKKAQSP